MNKSKPLTPGAEKLREHIREIYNPINWRKFDRPGMLVNSPDLTSQPLPLADTAAIAALLKVSTRQIPRLRALGMPTVYVNTAVRFRPAAVLVWLDERQAAATENVTFL